jgi:hypothetical protein
MVGKMQKCLEYLKREFKKVEAKRAKITDEFEGF